MAFFDTPSESPINKQQDPVVVYPSRTELASMEWVSCYVFWPRRCVDEPSFTMPRADPDEGAGVRTPALWKMTNSVGLYRNMQLDPLLLGKVGPHWTCWTVLLLGISESYSLMIVFFEKAMITGLPLQNKLRTYKIRRIKNNVRAFFQLSGLGTPPPPTTAKPGENFLDPRMDIRYRGGKGTMSRLKSFYSAAKI